MNKKNKDKKSFDNIMREMREGSVSEAEKGKKFEILMCKALPHIPPCSEWVEKVYMWRDWPYNEGKPDTGIDLVVEMEDGEWCAVQCKFYDEKTYLEDIATFLATSGQSFYVNGKKKSFKARLLITTTDRLTSNAESTIQKQTTEVMRLGLDELRAAPVDWGDIHNPAPKSIRREKPLHEYQKDAVSAVTKAFAGGETRGRMIMACGTGKTLTSMKIVEKVAGKNGNVLFCVPSIQLLSQSLKDYSADLDPRTERKFLAVCSDAEAGNADDSATRVSELAFPPTTDARLLARGLLLAKDKMTVVFSTYHSLKVISEAQKIHGAPDFDLIVCDEAHRTVGYEGKKEKEEGFYQIHKDEHVRAQRRLYMTATPKVYGTKISEKAEKDGFRLYGMDDEEVYGKEMFHFSFSDGIKHDVLADYCVHILVAKSSEVARLHREVIDEVGAENVIFEVTDAVKMSGVYKAICGTKAFGKKQPSLKKVLVFANKIKRSRDLIEKYFDNCAKNVDKLTPDGTISVKTEIRHVDGTMGAGIRNGHLSWLREDSEENECKILSNVRCLSEGIDVPALDGIVFYDAKQSQVEIVQALGRVMRKPKDSDKKYGHIIIPLCMADDAEADKFMDANEQFQTAWKVLQALRSHDNRFAAEVNKVELTGKLPERVNFEMLSPPEREGETEKGLGQLMIWGEAEAWMSAIIPKWIEICGDRGFWPSWVNDVSDVAVEIIQQIETLLKDKGKHADFVKIFGEYLAGLQRVVNKDVTEKQAMEMLAQHIITKPIFRALFDGYEFGDQNPISKALNIVENALGEIKIAAGEEKLEKFYKDVQMHVTGIEDIAGRRQMLEKIYGNFFQHAFKKDAQQQGIVYTPPEAVDFINHSVDALLRKNFKRGITDKNVHVLDPFTGCGQFVVRMLESGIIKNADVSRKFGKEIHANEKLLLPFYVATVNIEYAYQEQAGDKKYAPFTGGLLADTFNLSEKKGDYAGILFAESDAHADKQRQQNIQAIVSNPPYSAGQKKQSDLAPNPPRDFYPKLDADLRRTFIKPSAVRKKINYDSAYRALRWSMSRIASGGGGVIGFVTNASFLRAAQTDAVRKTLEEEMSEIYILDLRGDARTKGNQREKEKGNVFGGGTRVPVCVILMVRKSEKNAENFRLHYYDIGDYKTREEKLDFLKDNKENLFGIQWQQITPSPEGDWLIQRHPDFQSFFPMGNQDRQKSLTRQNRKSKSGDMPLTVEDNINGDSPIFDFYSLGVITSRDNWVCGFSQKTIDENMKMLIDEYNRQVRNHKKSGKIAKDYQQMSNIVEHNAKIQWSAMLLNYARRHKTASWDKKAFRIHCFRPFVKKHIYYDKMMNDGQYQTSTLYSKDEQNPTICTPGRGAKDWGVFAVDAIPNRSLLSGNAQSFPFYNYLGGEKRENISDATLRTFREFYKGQKINKWDVFHYVYGVLNHPSYQDIFMGSLIMESMPRIPFVRGDDFMGFVRAGKKLMNLHLNYENAEEYDIQQCDKDGKLLLNIDRASSGDLLEQMNFMRNTQKGVLKYNGNFFSIPQKVHAYKICGYSPLEWVETQYKHRILDNGVEQNPNDWGAEHNKPDYVWSLVRKSITVGIESARIIASLPELKYTIPDYKKLGKG